ncbi:YTH domain-containing protein ECT4 isoform X1 [Lactuca sativa]|nr:YTH domain-containing protein ECT4 isoform X1 [Lactuca sativa]
MDVYNVPEHGNADAYLIQGTTDPNSQLTNCVLEPLEAAMYNEGTPEFVVDQGMYYPSATNYGYICTGLESPGDWDDHHRVFGVDGQNIQFIGTQTESMPYVYYTTPSYGYAESPYNPYNPYIPGAMIGIGSDGSYVGAQQYYIPYENGASSPAYYPMLVPDTLTTTDQYMDMPTSNWADPSSANPTYTQNPTNHANSFGKVSEGYKSNDNKLPAANNGNGNGNGGVTVTSSSGKTTSNHNNGLKVSVPSGNNNLPNLSGNGRVVVDKVRSKSSFGKTTNDVSGNGNNPNGLGEQNRGPRSNSRLTVKAYSTRAGNSDAQGNIVISMDNYNKDDFPVEYVNAKFFVIKSYSEDDVHKSIKYNVWSSTPNGNKKLNTAYEEAQKISAAGDCPVFLFFSVNASGQFCGVAEMSGHVDFHKDMDFWQQDKWSGSFPVKWHIIKDVPNPHFRHIILENNEHKPVTNSRDTQEIKYKKGIEMLKVFKNYTWKTSLLDDFMYYENRQKILQEEKARLLIKSYGTPVFVPVLQPPRKLTNNNNNNNSNNFYDLASTTTTTTHDIIKNTSASTNHQDRQQQVVVEDKDDVLHFQSLSINQKEEDGDGGVLTVGSMPVKVNGYGQSSGFLTVGTIPLDPKALMKVKEGEAGDSKKKG